MTRLGEEPERIKAQKARARLEQMVFSPADANRAMTPIASFTFNFKRRSRPTSG